MDATFLAIRAVTSEYARRLLWPVLFIGCAIYGVLMGVVALLAFQISQWWWLLAFVPSLLFIVAVAIWGGVFIAAGRLSPPLNAKQRKATKSVVKQAGEAADAIGISRGMLLFRIGKDVLFPPKNQRSLIGELAETPGKLHREFENLRKLF